MPRSPTAAVVRPAFGRPRAASRASAPPKVRPAGVRVEARGVGAGGILPFSSPRDLGVRAALLARGKFRDDPVGRAEAAALELLVLASPEELGAASLSGSHLVDVVRSALSLDYGPMPASRAADLCGLASFVLSLDPAAAGIGAEELAGWRTLGSVCSVATAGGRDVVLSPAADVRSAARG